MSSFALLLIAQAAFTPALEQWVEDIVRLDGSRIVLLELEPSSTPPGFQLPRHPRHRDALAPYLSSPGFLAQFAAAQATSIASRDLTGKLSYVLLNPLQLTAGEAQREAAIAHELGHLWVKASGYAAPAYQSGPVACLSVLVGDIVQHPLIRREMSRRGIGYLQPWTADLEAALSTLESAGGSRFQPPPRCQALAQVALWVDVSLHLDRKRWPSAPRFLDLLAERSPGLRPVASGLVEYLRKTDLAGHAAHRAALQYVFDKLKSYALSLPDDESVH
jgi:hypothetical protein